jgi:hypothetical protein
MGCASGVMEQRTGRRKKVRNCILLHTRQQGFWQQLKGWGAGGAISQRFAKLMLNWSPRFAAEVSQVVGSEKPVVRAPEQSSLLWDVETVRLYVQERSGICVTVGRVNTARLLDMCGNHG